MAIFHDAKIGDFRFLLQLSSFARQIAEGGRGVLHSQNDVFYNLLCRVVQIARTEIASCNTDVQGFLKENLKVTSVRFHKASRA